MKRTLCTLLAALCVCAAACGCAPGAQSASGAAGPSAASSASSAASSSTSAASAALPASEPAESAPQPAGPAQMQQCMLPVYSGDGPVQTPLYAQADTASDVLAQIMPFDTVFVLREEGEFSEVCFGIMAKLRAEPPKEFAGYAVEKVADYKKPEETGLPAAMERTADGWRFSDFTSGADDTRWMEAMGPDFDPFEGQA